MPVPIAGTYMDRSLNDFQRACEHCIENEQEKPCPDTHLIDLLCDAVRLTRELAARDMVCNELVGRLVEANTELRRLHSAAASA